MWMRYNPTSKKFEIADDETDPATTFADMELKVPAPTEDDHASTKKYVDDAVGSGGGGGGFTLPQILNFITWGSL